jgi:hypothetical protein
MRTAATGDGEFEFDREDDDFAAAGGAADKLREMTVREIAETAPRPAARYTNVGPKSAAFMLADAATAVSCDGDKIKLWFHGGDGQTEAGKRIATLPNPAGTQPALVDVAGVRRRGFRRGVRGRAGHRVGRGRAAGTGLRRAQARAARGVLRRRRAERLPGELRWRCYQGGEYVAVGGDTSGIVSLIGVTDETFHNQNISVDVDSYIEQMIRNTGTGNSPRTLWDQLNRGARDGEELRFWERRRLEVVGRNQFPRARGHRPRPIRMRGTNITRSQ